MATIANLYHTDLTTKTQLLIAENVDLEKVITKYHPQTKETFVLYYDPYIKLAKIKNNAIIGEYDGGYPFESVGNFSLNDNGNRILVAYNFGQTGNSKTLLFYIDTTTMTKEFSDEFSSSYLTITNVTHTGTDEQYYITAGSTLYRYNADTQSIMYSIDIGSVIGTSYVKSNKIYTSGVTYLNASIGFVTDNLSGFSYTNIVSSTGNDIGLTDGVVAGYIYYGVTKTKNIRVVNLITNSYDTLISLSTYNLSNPSGLATETTTNRVLFSATDNATGNHNLYELKSDNTIEAISGYEKLGGFSNNNDLMGGQLDLVFK